MEILVFEYRYKYTSFGLWGLESAVLATSFCYQTCSRTWLQEKWLFHQSIRSMRWCWSRLLWLAGSWLLSTRELGGKPDIGLPGILGLLSEAFDSCGEFCAEYTETFYLGKWGCKLLVFNNWVCSMVWV